jgi:hypothetical protein
MAGLIWVVLLTGVLQTNLSTDDVERRLGPYTVSGESFTVVLRNKRFAAGSEVRFSETLSILEVRDRTGAVAYQREFPYELDGRGFKQVVSASARLLPGEGLAGLLIEYRKDPAPAGSEQYWQIFRFRNGKLGLFDASMTTGQPPQNAFLGAAGLGRNAAQPFAVNRGEMAEIKVWTGNFYANVPIRVDWAQGHVMSGQQCFELMGGSMGEVSCEMRAEALRNNIDSDLGFVRLFHEAKETMGTPRHVVFTKDSKIEILAAKAITRLQVADGLFQINLSDVWLKVLIDDSEENFGWIHTNEDFSAVGLPSRSPSP